jgi:hypothetical protein
MASEAYQEYLRVIGKLKDIYKLDVDVDHSDIHSFSKDKRPLFKLFFGVFEEDPKAEPSIVVSFHIDLYHPEAITWYVALYKIHPGMSIHDSYIEDSAGETYLGEDALTIKNVYNTQEVLSNWLESADRNDMEEYVKSGVYGRDQKPNKSFDSQNQSAQAIIEFERIKKPEDEGNIH